MGTKEILAKMKEIQQNLLEYLEKKDDVEETLQNFKAIFKDHKIIDGYLMLTLRLISQISNEHYREEKFYQKIEKILIFLKKDIQIKYSNSAIFDIFKFNKRLLLFLIKEGILTPNRYICKQMMREQFKKMRYPEYFFPEIKQFIPAFIKPKKNESNYGFKYDFSFYEKFSEKLPENFEEKRKTGENDDHICHLIRNDLIDEFITYVNKNDISLNASINPSIYETHPLLLQKQDVPKSHYNKKTEEYGLIEYATFFGSTQIFKYLYKNKAKLNPTLWIYAIHSDNPEIFHLFEEMNLEIPSNDILFIESIKSHHNSITNYIIDQYGCEKEGDILIQYFNFIQMDDEIFDDIELSVLCKYDYSPIISELIKTTTIDFNEHIEDEFDNDSDVEFSEKCEDSLLYYAIRNGSIETVKLLASCNQVDINSPFSVTRYYSDDSKWDGWDDIECELEVSPLLVSIEKGIFDIVDILLSNGARVDNEYKFVRCDDPEYAEDYCTFSILYYAVKSENPEIAKLFISENKKIETEKNIFAYHDYDGNGQHIRDESKSSLHLAIEKNDVEMVKLLIENEILDVNDTKTSSNYSDEHEEWSIFYDEVTTNPICIAAENNNIEIVKILLNDLTLEIDQMKTSIDNCIYYNDCGDWDQSRNGCCNCSSKSEASYFNGKSEKKSALHIAIENGNIEMVKLLLENKIDVNAFSEFDHRCYDEKEKDEHIIKKLTPLYIAIEKDNIDIVKLLLENERIDVNLPSLIKISPCHFECDDENCEEEEEEENVQEEEEKKVQEEKTTPLCFAKIKGNQEIIDLLMEHKNIELSQK